MKSKKAFMLGAAMAASCFVSAFALAEQAPLKLSAQTVKQAVDKALKPGGTLEKNSLSDALKQKLNAAKAGQTKVVKSKPVASNVAVDTKLSELQKPDPAQMKQAAIAEFTPLFPTLDINTLYTLTGVETGAQIAYHFNLPKNSRIQVQLLNQSAGTDMSLTLFHDDGQGNLTPLGTSDNPGSADEYLNGVLPAGDYYWFMVANTASNAQFSFGVAVDSNIDAYEPNDTEQTAFVLPDALNQVAGNLDTVNDVDYFAFTSLRGQGVGMFLGDDEEGTRNQWIFERFDGTKWVVIPPQTTSTYPSLTPGYTVKVRVRANPDVALNPQAQYKLTLGSAPRLNQHNVNGDNVVRIPSSIAQLATQAARSLSWSTQWSDSTGEPLRGVTPVLRVDKHFSGPYNFTNYEARTGITGAASGNVDLGTCSGDYRVVYPDSGSGQTYNWETWFNEGGWRLELKEFPGVGVGGNIVQTVSMGHICSQRIVR
ncbi:hypothetical protein YA0745_29455 [Pseudomonas synxantha]|uniref:Lipoprotein n=1 Tax=Pseudomonas synxantha TaxID=47883 RepID=A0ABS0USX8_9PSED|nr:hypothetical protein [Pseudomonas synxantha]MBI6568389.1 hypothetical protein [Pseudomonas synxantha]MBI6582513.1 hypothetical protein [Pseudomonas synxantha]MBI6647042.1 hypothetical protein [Pseudomonas synxantha]